MLYGFRITPPESQEERREDHWQERIEEFTRCQSHTLPAPVTQGARNTRSVGRREVSRKGVALSLRAAGGPARTPKGRGAWQGGGDRLVCRDGGSAREPL
jgi:hypothetical protein